MRGSYPAIQIGKKFSLALHLPQVDTAPPRLSSGNRSTATTQGTTLIALLSVTEKWLQKFTSRSCRHGPKAPRNARGFLNLIQFRSPVPSALKSCHHLIRTEEKNK